eukprot:366206-Chlamydomonas_euryale.AAC.7
MHTTGRRTCSRRLDNDRGRALASKGAAACRPGRRCCPHATAAQMRITLLHHPGMWISCRNACWLQPHQRIPASAPRRCAPHHVGRGFARRRVAKHHPDLHLSMRSRLVCCSARMCILRPTCACLLLSGAKSCSLHYQGTRGMTDRQQMQFKTSCASACATCG